MRVYVWCDGAAMPNGGPAGAGYVVVGGVHLLSSEALGDATNNVAEYTAVRNALRAGADSGATSAHVRMDSPVVFGHLSGASRARAEHLIQLKEEVEAQVARPGPRRSPPCPVRSILAGVVWVPTRARRGRKLPARTSHPSHEPSAESPDETARCRPLRAGTTPATRKRPASRTARRARGSPGPADRATP